MLNYAEARTEMRALFLQRYLNYFANGFTGVTPRQITKRNASVGYTPEVKWQRVETKDINDTGVHWMIFSSRNIIRNQKTLAGGRVQEVGTRYTAKGLVRVDLYFSKSAYQTEDVDFLNLIVERCFDQANTPGGVWFYNSNVNELEPEESHFRSNVLAEYSYDSVIL